MVGVAEERAVVLQRDLQGPWFPAGEPFARDSYAGEMGSCFIPF